VIPSLDGQCVDVCDIMQNLGINQEPFIVQTLTEKAIWAQTVQFFNSNQCTCKN
jgi:hypothetical protein